LPSGSLIFDEAFYVNAARVILGWDVPDGAHYAGATPGLDPNIEHPPLGKLLMAGSMAVFGDNGLGWRLPSVIAGMIALGALYGIVRATGESRWLGVLAVGLFALDNLAFVHGRIGTLDMMALAAILLASWAALRGRWLAAGALTGLGLLVKLTALYGLLALSSLAALALLATWLREHRLQRSDLWPPAMLIAGCVIVAGAGLWALDARFTKFTNPIDHARHMLEYGAALTRQGGPPTDCISNDSTPWQWLVNDCEMRYLRIAETTTVEDDVIATHASVDFRGAMNPVLLGAAVLGVPFAAWIAWRRRSRLATWTLVWMAANYLPFIPLVVFGHRITYIYYFLPVVPALAAAIAVLLLRSGLPRVVAWAFLGAYIIGYAAYFPFRQIP
jgi:4-amino-4-deoxy-L-arabinose transferase-like glycosyltransferase